MKKYVFTLAILFVGLVFMRSPQRGTSSEIKTVERPSSTTAFIETLSEKSKVKASPKTPPVLTVDSRFDDIGQLSQRGVEALPALTQLVAAKIEIENFGNDPHSVGAMRLSNERSVRITALETIDQLAAQGIPVIAELNYILENQKDPVIAFLTEVSLKGIYQNRPGKLTRFIDESFASLLKNEF